MYVTEVLKDDPKLTSALIAQNLNISTKTVMRIFKSLKEKHVLVAIEEVIEECLFKPLLITHNLYFKSSRNSTSF